MMLFISWSGHRVFSLTTREDDMFAGRFEYEMSGAGYIF